MTNDETMALLQRFCASKSDGREYLHKPILRDACVFATNGHIIIRVPADPGLAAEPSKFPADLKNRFAGIDPDRLTYVDIPKLPEMGQCDFCGGTGAAAKCADCEGAGEFDRNGWTYQCQSCDGEGQIEARAVEDQDWLVPCNACDGAGVIGNDRVEVGNSGYANRYLRMIADLPGVRFAPRGKTDAAYFSFDGGDGLLMPRRA